MTPFQLTMTVAGLQRFAAAQVDDDIDLSIAQIGLSDQAFVAAPTLTALPGDFRRITTISGKPVGDNIVHLTLLDDEAIGYGFRGLGLFLSDGTLFASYAQADRIGVKTPATALMLAIDIAFPTAAIDELTFGDTSFLLPPATTVTPGLARLATAAEVDAGASQGVVTAAMLRRALPIGTITLWYGAAIAVPVGWAICDGREVDRSDGAGRILTPDMRGRVAAGAGGGYAPGETFGADTVDTAEAGQHTHGIDLTSGSASAGIEVNTTLKTDTASGGTTNSVQTIALLDDGHAHDVDGATAPGGAHRHSVDVRQPSRALLFIMKV